MNSLNTLNSLNTTNSINTINLMNNDMIIDDNMDLTIPEYSNSALEELIENTDNLFKLYGFFNDIKISSYNPTTDDFVEFMKNENRKYFCIRSRKMLYKSPKHGIIGIDRGNIFNENPNNMTIGYVNYEKYYGINLPLTEEEQMVEDSEILENLTDFFYVKYSNDNVFNFSTRKFEYVFQKHIVIKRQYEEYDKRRLENLLKKDHERIFNLDNKRLIYKSKKHGIVGIIKPIEDGDPIRFGHINYEEYFEMKPTLIETMIENSETLENLTDFFHTGYYGDGIYNKLTKEVEYDLEIRNIKELKCCPIEKKNVIDFLLDTNIYKKTTIDLYRSLYKSQKHGIVGVIEYNGQTRFGYIDYIHYYDLHNN